MTVKIKKTAVLLMALVLVLGFAGCSTEYSESSFSQELLEYAKAEDMPLPSGAHGVKKYENGEGYAFVCTAAEFSGYIKSLTEYFCARDDVYFFGEVISKPSMYIFLPEYTLYKVDDDFDYDKSIYTFQYSFTDEIGSNWNGKSTVAEQCVEITVEYGKFTSQEKFDAEIIISRSASSALLDSEDFDWVYNP